MTRGRKPQSAELQEARGNPGKRAKAKAPAVDQTKLGRASVPAELDAAARRVWEREAPALEAMNFLKASDRNAFARYCEAIVRYWVITKKLRKIGETYETDSAHGKMVRVHPLFHVQERLEKRLVALEDRFGMSPAARQQIMQRLAAVAPQLPFEDSKPDQAEHESEPGSPSATIGFLNAPAAGHA